MTRTLLILCTFALLTTDLGARVDSGAITVGENVHVSKANSELIHFQTVADVDPDDPRHLIACANLLVREPETGFRVVVYVSFDAGQHWTETLRKEGEGLHPSCAFGHDGAAYVTTLGREECLPSTCTYSTLVIFRSADGGRRWSRSEGYYHAGDHPYIVVDNASQRFRNTLYITALAGAMPYDSVTSEQDWAAIPSGMVIYTSADGAKSFSAPLSVFSSHGRSVEALGETTVMADGTYVLMFPELMESLIGQDAVESLQKETKAWIKVATSHDGAKTLEAAVVVAATTWDLDQSLTSAFQSGIAADTSSGPFRNRLYVVWQAKRLGRHRIWLSHSDDVGKSWSEAVAVDDAPPNPAGGPDDFGPAVAVNKVGVVGIIWSDRRDHLDGLGWHTRFSASLDGGDTFLPSVRVSTVPMSFTGRHHVTFTGRFFKTVEDPPSSAVGYTMGFAASPSGVFHAVWVDNRTGTPQLWTAPISVSGTVSRNGSEGLSGLVDITSSAKVQIGNAFWDWSTGEFTCDLFVKNVSSISIAGPLRLRILRIDSALGIVTEAQANGRPVSAGSVLDISSDGLKAGSWSEPVHFTAKVKVLFGPHHADAAARLLDIFTIDSRTFAPATPGGK